MTIVANGGTAEVIEVSSSPSLASQEQQQQPRSTAASNDTVGDAEFAVLLSVFYKRIFPFADYHRWLKYAKPTNDYFARREFSFTLANDIYIRFQSFETGDDLKQEIVKMSPVKIDVGAVYSARPKLKKTVRPGVFVPVEKELVFDIDMTDYDEIRTCCQGGDICSKCWPFMTIAIKVIHRALKEDFGFKHLMWVYSGRRGVHCWVCDERARKMSNEARSSIVRYLEIVKGGEKQARKVYLPNRGPMHPSLDAAYQVLKSQFIDLIVKEQRVLEQPASASKLLALISDEQLRKRAASACGLDGKDDDMKVDEDDMGDEDSAEDAQVAVWSRFVGSLHRCTYKDNLLRDIIFQYCYPRLDDKVSININHLLKSPFCVHPKTHRVCVPIDPDNCDAFDPFAVPTLTDLVGELNAHHARQDTDMNVDGEPALTDEAAKSDWDKTSLKPHIAWFRAFLQEMEQEERRKRREEHDRSLEF
ncbi:p48 polypeptide of DNA primase [Sorochytrium milnesiophthora]